MASPEPFVIEGDLRVTFFEPWRTVSDAYADWGGRLRGEACGLRVETSFYCIERVGDENSLVRYFEAISADWKGWEGEKIWASDCANVSITSTFHRSGTVRLCVIVSEDQAGGWRAEASSHLDFETRKHAARDARRFFGSLT